MNLDPALNDRVINFGREVFQDLGDVDPSLFDPRYLNTILMRWSMSQPDFKVNLFRLVDVLPTLSSDEAIAEHVR